MVTSVVKLLESAGARVMFLNWRLSESSLRQKLSKINGVVFPGGGLDFLIEREGNYQYEDWTNKALFVFEEAK